MDAMRMASELTLYMIVVMAVCQDLMFQRISNRLIVMGLIISVMFVIALGNTSEILYILINISFPVIVLYLLYLAGILGAGDIKLFSVIGAFVNFKMLWSCIIVAFIAAAAISLLLLVYRKNLRSSVMRGMYYLRGLLCGDIHSYHSLRRDENLMHFSVAILLGLFVTQFILNV